MTRFQRLGELVPPKGKNTLYGTFDPAAMVKILRDHHNPLTGNDIPADQFDNGGTIGNNGCIYSIVFAPKRRVFWVAAGQIPVPNSGYTGFSLDELFGVTGAKPPSPDLIP